MTDRSQFGPNSLSFGSDVAGLAKNANSSKVFIQADESKLSLFGSGESQVLLSGLSLPSVDTDAANKAYVDQVAQGLHVKHACNAATTDALTKGVTVSLPDNTITISAANNESGFSQGEGLTIDGVLLRANDFVLIKDGAGATNANFANGIYKLGGIDEADLVLTRADNMDQTDEIIGSFTFVTDGESNINQGFVVSEPDQNDTFTLGSHSIDWYQFSGAGALEAGHGMTKNGNTIDLDASIQRITTLTNAELKFQTTEEGKNVIDLANADGNMSLSSAEKSVNINADRFVAIDGARGINIGTASNVDVDFNAATFDLDASEAVQINANENSIFTVEGAGKSLTLLAEGGGETQKLNLYSAGTGDKAIHLEAGEGGLTAEVAGGIKLDTQAALTMNADASSSLTVAGENQTLTVEASGTMDVNAATFDLDCSEAITLDSSAASVDLTAATRVTLNASSEDANAIELSAVGGIDMDAVGGAITLDSGESSVDLTANTKVTLTAASNEVDAIKLNASAGGVDVDASGKFDVDAGEAITLDSSAASVDLKGKTKVTLTAEGNEADAMKLASSGGLDVDAAQAITLDSSAASVDLTAATRVTLNASSEDANAIELSAVGGIDMDAVGGAITLDSGESSVDLTANTKVTLTAASNEVDAIKLNASEGGVDINAAKVLALDGTEGINIGTASNVDVDFNAATFDLDASEAVQINAADNSNITVAGENKSLTVSASGAFDLDAAGIMTIDSATSISIGSAANQNPIDMKASTFALDTSDDMAFTSAAGKTITLTCGGGAADADLLIDSKNCKLSATSAEFNVSLVCSSVTCSSDAIFKKNIETIEKPLETIEKMRGVNWDWKSDNSKSSGVIAQELLKQLPWAVHGQEGHYSVNYSALSGYFIEAIKSLNQKIKELENKN